MCHYPDLDTTHHPEAGAADAGAGTGTITAAVRALMPTQPVCAEALTLAKAALPASILYHSFRVYLYAQAFLRIFDDDIAARDHPPAEHRHEQEQEYTFRAPPHVLFVACILHDIGTAPQHDSVPERFEVVGADVAARLLRAHDVPDPAVRDVWLAMALHTSPGIAERLGGTVRAVRLAVRADFGSYPAPPPESIPGGADMMSTVRWKLPRLEIEKELGDAVVRQALLDRIKAPAASWPGDLLRAKVADPEWEGVNQGF
ncbi:hypothetical protein B0T22DRAFT_40593 [Podospora appendiculata]|uniref:HD/PDEase domain-containing protein n=1 Tax=Podospora appendiculata TaxID=314037 RepID=A0AAE0XH99_9PEZI|nr:hypothetical protein B0T22DRAFT_40593 [Podospora appendiculata]